MMESRSLVRLVRLCGALALGVLLPALADANRRSPASSRTHRARFFRITVEASSPVLIEKPDHLSPTAPANIGSSISGPARTRYIHPYRIQSGKREGFTLAADFVATANAELKVGGLEERSRSPVRARSSTSRRRENSRRSISICSVGATARGYAAVMLLIPSMSVGRWQRQRAAQPRDDRSAAAAAAATKARARSMASVPAPRSTAAASRATDSSKRAGSRDDDRRRTGRGGAGGPIVNFIPKTGGNSFQHHFYGSGMSNWMQSSNYTTDLKAAGMTTPQETLYLAEGSLSDGGPLKKDRIWFFFNTRYSSSGNTLPGIYYNLNAAIRRSGRTSRT